MVAKDVITEVACVVMSDGVVVFTLNDQTSVNTAIEAWREALPEEVLAKHRELGTGGGVVVVKMLSSDFHKLKKVFKP